MTDIALLLGIIASVSFTVMIFSFMFKPNISFRVAEHIFIGTAVGISTALAISSLLNTAIRPLSKDLLNIVPIALGLMLFTVFMRSKSLKKLTWLRQLPLALIVATGFAITVRSDVDASFWRQFVTIWNAFRTTNIGSLFDASIILIAAVTTISYFIYTKEHKNAQGRTTVLGQITRAGRFCLMVFFGASFGNIVLSRMTLIIGLVFNIIESLRTLLQALLGA
jgi:hypothetical protein